MTPPTVSDERRPIEALEAASGQPAYLLAAARAANRWLPGQELTADQFNEAVKAVKGSVI